MTNAKKIKKAKGPKGKANLSASDFMLALATEARTDEAKALGQALATEAGWSGASKTGKRGRPKDNSGRAKALAAIVGSILLGAAKDRKRLFWLPLSVGSFSGAAHSYRSTKDALAWLQERGWIKLKRKGHFNRENYFDKDGAPPNRGEVTRWTATTRLFTFAERHGVTPEDAREHYGVALPKRVLELRSPRRYDGPKKVKGRLVKIVWTSEAERIASEVKEINQFLSEFEIGGAVWEGFKRCFNECKDPATYKWNKGGRLTSIGSDSYQSQPKEIRRGITFDGKLSVEIDVRASHLTILYGLRGVALDPELDPYEVEGIPRDIAKAWLTVAIGAGTFPSRWPSENKEEFENANQGQQLQSVYPIRTVEAAFLKRHPILKDWPKSKVSCFDLMYIESQAIIRTMQHLMCVYRIPSLPVHDSLIVPKAAKARAIEFLRQHFKYEAGIEPVVRES